MCGALNFICEQPRKKEISDMILLLLKMTSALISFTVLSQTF